MSRRLLVSICIVLGTLALYTEAIACTCGPRPTVLDAYENADLVVRTRLKSVDKIREKEREYDVGYIRSVTMIVDKVYKGDVKAGTEIKIAQGGGADCIWTFDESWIDEEFLFYLGKPSIGPSWGDGMNSATTFPREGGPITTPMYHAVTCGRSNGLKGATDDISFLENLASAKGRTRISGTLQRWFGAEFDSGNIEIQLIGKDKTFTARTNKDGFFEIYDLPAGNYHAKIDVPFGWKINDYMVGQTSRGFEEYDPAAERKGANQIPIRIVKGRHANLDLYFDIDTAIKGRVLSPAGTPMKGVCVKAVSTELKEGDYRGAFDCTNEKGEFVVEEMRPGNYRLVVNDDGKIDADEPFGVLFYPGVDDYTNAGIIAVEAGKYVTDRVIRVPNTVELVVFSGRFFYSDGRPVIDEWVRFVPDDAKRYDDMSQKTDKAGNLTFRLPKGASGKISGEMYTYIGEFTNCNKLDELIKATGKTFLTAKSNVVTVNGVSPGEPISLSFPFPSCTKSKE